MAHDNEVVSHRAPAPIVARRFLATIVDRTINKNYIIPLSGYNWITQGECIIQAMYFIEKLLRQPAWMVVVEGLGLVGLIGWIDRVTAAE